MSTTTTVTNGGKSQPVRKTAVVTGGASGLGSAMAQHFAREGYHVAILDVGAEAGHALASTLRQQQQQQEQIHQESARTAFWKCDVSSWQDQAAAFQDVFGAFGRIDVVCANAGISEAGVSAMMPVADEEYDENAPPEEPRLKVLDVNLTGVIYTVKLAVHYMRKNKALDERGSRGNIICTASNVGLYAFPVSPLYSASKAGVIGLVRSMGPVLERHQIRINALAPAVLMTNIAPDKSLFANMVITPIETLVAGVQRLLQDGSINGEVAEIHGNSVTLRPVHEFVDEDSRKNLEQFWKLGFA